MRESAPKTVFVCGVAGVGKTHLINRVIAKCPTAVTYRASAIIQEARRVADPDALRSLPIDEIAASQELLIGGLSRLRDHCTAALLVLDGHSVIDSEDGFFDVTVETMKRLRVHSIVHLEDSVERIKQRRDMDTTRERPRRSLEQLAAYQSRSLRMCQSYQSELSIPLTRCRTGDEAELANLLSQLLAVR
jgi:adenylate kinase